MSKLLKSIAAGILIGIAAHMFSQYSLIGEVEKILVAVLFSGALCSIKVLKLNLFTGSIGYLQFNKPDILKNLIILLGNLIGISIVAVFCISPEAANIFQNKIADINIVMILMKSVFCGILMYSAVEIFDKHSVVGILMMVPMFLLAGFEHSIANSFYLIVFLIKNFNFSNLLTSIVFLVISILGNAIGAITFRRITKI